LDLAYERMVVLTARHATTSSAPVATPTTGAKSAARQLGAIVASTITLSFALFLF
jgi:hypothetical protein